METEKVQVSQTRYVFLFIGDGMALTRINAAEAYLKAQQKTSVGVEKLAFSQFPNQGLTTTYDAGSFITDSVPPPELQLRRVTRPFRT